MSNVSANDRSETAEEHRKPGRQKGAPKPPGSGRKKGTPNKIGSEVRQLILNSGIPVATLLAIASGRRLLRADPAARGKRTKIYPTLTESMTAAEILLRKVLPDARSLEMSGPDGRPIKTEEHYLPAHIGPIERAQRLAAMLQEGKTPNALDTLLGRLDRMAANAKAAADRETPATYHLASPKAAGNGE